MTQPRAHGRRDDNSVTHVSTSRTKVRRSKTDPQASLAWSALSYDDWPVPRLFVPIVLPIVYTTAKVITHIAVRARVLAASTKAAVDITLDYLHHPRSWVRGGLGSASRVEYAVPRTHGDSTHRGLWIRSDDTLHVAPITWLGTLVVSIVAGIGMRSPQHS